MPGHSIRFALVTLVTTATFAAPVADAMAQGPQTEPHQLRAFAPGSKQLAVSGSIYFDNNDNGAGNSSYTSLGAGGRYSPFVKRGLGIGVSLNFNNYSGDFSGSGAGSYDGSSWSAGPAVEYYIGAGRLVKSARGAMFPFLAASFQMSHGSDNFADNSGGLGLLSRSTSNGTAVTAEVGVLYMLGDWAGLTLSAQYRRNSNRRKSTNEVPGNPPSTTSSKSTNDNTTLGVGTRWFLF